MNAWKNKFVDSIEIIKSTAWKKRYKKFTDIEYHIIDDLNSDLAMNSRYTFSNTEHCTEVSYCNIIICEMFLLLILNVILYL